MLSKIRPLFGLLIIGYLTLISSSEVKAGICARIFVKTEQAPAAPVKLPNFLGLPKGTKVITVMPEHPLSGHGYLDQLSPIQTAIAKRYPINAQSPDVAIYVASGIDGLLTHAALPDARLHITIDDSPTFRIDQLQENLPVEQYLGSGRLHGAFVPNGINSDTSGPDLLKVIIRSLPENARIRHLTFMVPPNERVGKLGGHPVPAVHFLLAYDHGEGTPLAYHWHIQGELPRTSEVAKSLWWFQTILRLHPAAIMTKASSGAVTAEMAKYFAQIVKMKNGFLLEDTTNGFASDGDETEFIPINGDFGYGRGALLVFPK